LLWFNTVSLSFQPERVLLLCWVSTETVCGLWGRVSEVASEHAVTPIAMSRILFT
jgi:hypothetical protein